ncbi:MAG: TIGR03088 family PEP-CTERM/XrtA system glycosyltransferase [Rhodocyclaceae bacterium]
MNTPPALIAHIVYSFRVGGLENGLVNLINRLPAERYRHAIVSMTDIDEAFCARIERPDVQYIALAKGPGHGVGLFPRMYRTLAHLAPDVTHTRNIAALEMNAPAWAARVPVRVHGEHGWDVNDPGGTHRPYQWVRRAYKPFVTHYIALSRELDAYLAGPVGVGTERRSLICNGVNTARFAPQAARADDMPFTDPALFVFGTVGRMQAVKDHVGLVRAFAAVLHALPHARLVIVGDGALRADVEAAVRALGLGDAVWLPGERSDVPALMRQMDCFVLPSLAEGISNTVLEAMACGLPVIATEVGGNPELVVDGHTGSLVPPANPQALAVCMSAYARDAGMAAVRGAAGRARIEAEFSLEAMVGRYDEVYQTLLARRGHRLAWGV